MPGKIIAMDAFGTTGLMIIAVLTACSTDQTTTHYPHPESNPESPVMLGGEWAPRDPGDIDFDESKPDGTPRKLLNVDKINSLGWQATIDLEAGLTSTYHNFENNYLYYIHHKDNRPHELIHV